MTAHTAGGVCGAAEVCAVRSDHGLNARIVLGRSWTPEEPAIGRRTTRRPVVAVRADGRRDRRPDTLAVEEPLELRVNGRALTVTMRTPGDDVELVHGFLLTEGVIGGREDVLEARYCDSRDADGRNTFNVLDVLLAPDVLDPHVGVERRFYTNSACGVCGKTSLDAVRTSTRCPPGDDPVRISMAALVELPHRLRAAQRVFDTTGGLHAAALFTAEGELLAAREDVGRHNAVDKVLGWALLEGRYPARGTVLMVSGRASFELVQKAVMAGVPVLAAVSAPSSLAVDLALASGMTLVGFLRGETMNVYAGMERVLDAAPASAVDVGGSDCLPAP